MNKQRFFICTAAVLLIATLGVAVAIHRINRQKEDESTFQTIQGIEESRIWDLVGTTIDTSKPPKNAQDEVYTVQKYTEYQLKDGGTLRINE